MGGIGTATLAAIRSAGATLDSYVDPNAFCLIDDRDVCFWDCSFVTPQVLADLAKLQQALQQLDATQHSTQRFQQQAPKVVKP